MGRRRKLKRAEITLAKTIQVHERIAIDAPEQLRVAPVDVQDPYNPEETIRVVRSTRDPLTWMHSRGAIDEPQRLAGEFWRHCWNRAQFGGRSASRTIRNIDGSLSFNFDTVEGGKIYEPISDSQIKAGKYLDKCAAELGKIGNWIIHRCLGDGLFPDQIAALFGFHGERATRYYTRRIREALETLATLGSRK